MLYAPEWQFKALLTWATELYVVAPRGTGKTERIQAVRALDCVKAMPRAKGAMIAVSYKKLKTHLLPPLISSWKTVGYERGKDFWIGTDKRPKSWKIDEPYIMPTELEDFIQFSNGHGIHLISQDRAGMANGLSVEWIGADEVRSMNKARFDEDASAILRGQPTLFEHLPQYRAITMTTDMPWEEESMWILEMEKSMDSELIEAIYEMALSVEAMRAEIKLKQKSGKKVSKHELADLNTARQWVNTMRLGPKDEDGTHLGTVHYLEVADGSNLLFLGKRFILTQFRTMQRERFNTSILGLRPDTTQGKFYPAFNVNKHGYYASNHNYLEKLDVLDGGVDDCRTDSDLLTTVRLHIAFDHNSSINCLGVAQVEGRTHRTVKSFYVLGREGKKLSDVVQEFIDYYFFHPNKDVVYHYDHTSIPTDAQDDETFKDEIVKLLRAAKWNITENYLGKAPFHDLKFKTIQNIHANDGTHQWKSLINRDNNEQLIKVLQLTDGEVSGGKWQKDKKKEKQVKTFPQEDAPHLSDMYDVLLLATIQYESTDHNWMIT